MRHRRQISEEERALWSGFTRSIAPLSGPRDKAQPSAVADDAAAPTSSRPAARREAPPAEQSPPLAPLGRRLRQRVVRGRELIDARIDLHGLTQHQAHRALVDFLRRAQAAGARIVLVVTGKGTGQGLRQSLDQHRHDAVVVRGVLRRQVPIWLSLPEFRSFVVGFEDAHAFHGGQGALYVRLRRRRGN